MIALLRSDDQPLSELCNAILAESNTEADHPVFIPEASTPLDTADVSIRDQLPEPNRHIFLIDRDGYPQVLGSGARRIRWEAPAMAPMQSEEEEYNETRKRQ